MPQVYQSGLVRFSAVCGTVLFNIHTFAVVALELHCYTPAHRAEALRNDAHQVQKVKGRLAGGGGILWRPPAQLVDVV